MHSSGTWYEVSDNSYTSSRVWLGGSSSRSNSSTSCSSTVIVRVIAEAGVIAHAGVITPLCVNFSSLESLNLFIAQGSESSCRGAMTSILVPISSVRLHAMACGLRTKIVPRSVSLEVCNRGSPLFVASIRSPRWRIRLSSSSDYVRRDGEI